MSESRTEAHCPGEKAGTSDSLAIGSLCIDNDDSHEFTTRINGQGRCVRKLQARVQRDLVWCHGDLQGRLDDFEYSSSSR